MDEFKQTNQKMYLFTDFSLDVDPWSSIQKHPLITDWEIGFNITKALQHIRNVDTK